MGRTEVVRSLATGNLREAGRRARLVWLSCERLFEMVSSAPTLTRSEVEAMVAPWLERWSWRDEVRLAVGEPLVHSDTPLPPGAEDAILETLAHDYREALACNDLSMVRTLATELAEQHGIAPDGADAKILARTLLRSIVENTDDLLRRREGVYPPLPKAPGLVAPKPEAVTPAPTLTGATVDVEVLPPAKAPAASPALRFSDIYARHEKAMRFPANGEEPYTEQTIKQNAATVRLWIEFHGDHPLARYTRDDAEEFKNALRYLPNLHGKSKAWRMEMRDAVEKVQALHEAGQTPPPCLSMKTVKRHMSALSTFFDWVLGQKKIYGYRCENIFRQHKYGSVDPNQKMWDEEDINVLFRTPIWTGCTPTRRAERGSVIVYDAYYWLPLLAFFHGLRQEEIAQLRASDVHKDDGVWVFGIHREDGNHLKNHTAIRSVPIHDQLIELGFLKYVELIRENTNDHLWPTLKRGGPDKKFAHYYRQRFMEYCRDTGIYDRKRPFHALRATFRTFMEETEAKSAHVSKIAGHKLTVVLGEGATYTRRIKASVLKAAIDMFKPDVDLSHLRPFRPGEDRIAP